MVWYDVDSFLLGIARKHEGFFTCYVTLLNETKQRKTHLSEAALQRGVEIIIQKGCQKRVASPPDWNPRGWMISRAPSLQASSLRGEARVVNHSSAARVMDDMENKLQAKYLAPWWDVVIIIRWSFIYN